MKGHENLIPLNKRTKEEQRRIATEGGKASGKKRRDKRTFRETLQTLLEMPYLDENRNPIINDITGKPMSIREGLAVTAVQCSMSGDVKHLQTILDVLGERVLKIDSTVNGAMSANISIAHIVSGHQPASSEAEVRERDGLEFEDEE